MRTVRFSLNVMSEGKSAPDLRSPKARQILAGAREAFLELGFEGASVDAIARRAGVSKGTIYNYFPDKTAIFAAFVEGICQDQAQAAFGLDELDHGIEASLRRLCRRYVEFLLTPLAQNAFRVAVAEAQRFPDLGRAFYDSGPDLGVRRLTQFLAVARDRGELEIDDLDLAAHQLSELCKADLFYKRLLSVKRTVQAEEIERVADGAAQTFLRAYGKRS
jgi:AcrR family transcriptional regulator